MFLDHLKNEANYTTTENGATTYRSTQNYCLDLFATIGALRGASDDEIMKRFDRAFAEDREMAMKILFYARDIRGGLGERRVFRTILKNLAEREPETIKKNLWLIPEYGRWDDLLCLLDGKCGKKTVELLKKQLNEDIEYHNRREIEKVSLLAKWLPSVNTSNKEAVRLAKKLARKFRIPDRSYRMTLTALRKDIRIIENYLREKDYTFDYSKQPSRAMMKYRKAFLHHDRERYSEFMDKVAKGEKKLNTGTLQPYDIIRICLEKHYVGLDTDERKSLDVTWNALEDFTNGSNSLVVMDGSGSMTCSPVGSYRPIDVAMSLAIYFAEHTKGSFHNHFITFGAIPQMVEIKGEDILEKVRYCERFNDCSNTDLQATFNLLLRTAVRNHVPQSEMPETLYIISDMEFDRCSNSDLTNFEEAKRKFESYGYRMPNVVFWNVASRNEQQPVKKNEQGVALVSGASARTFQMVISGETDPMEFMYSVILSERYAPVHA